MKLISILTFFFAGFLVRCESMLCNKKTGTQMQSYQCGVRKEDIVNPGHVTVRNQLDRLS
jgi:hypothetical protein